ncbi:MAG: dihydroneopterin aldolase [Armatimonadetes bacterium]|nr:dihydroneopterin aldolase [Armatimonadota bacterium]
MTPLNLPDSSQNSAMDTIFLKGIRVFGHHGHTAEERCVGQIIEVDVELRLDLRKAGRTDRLKDTADWYSVFQTVTEAVTGNSHKLMEHLASDIASRLLATTPAHEVTISVSKPSPPLGGICERCGVKVTRSGADFSGESPA